MNASILILGALILLPVILLIFLRVNATLVFLSLCLGNVLDEFVTKDISSFLNSHSNSIPQQAASAPNSTIKLAVLLLPVVLTTLFMIRTIHGKGRLMLNALPAIGVGFLGSLLVVPLLPNGISHNILSSNIWTQANKYQDYVVGLSAIISLIVLWLQRPKSEGKHSKGHKE